MLRLTGIECNGCTIINICVDCIEEFIVGDSTTYSDHAPIMVSLSIAYVNSGCRCCTSENHFGSTRMAAWNNEYREDTREDVLDKVQSLDTSLSDMMNSTESCVENLSLCINYIFEKFCIHERIILTCT